MGRRSEAKGRRFSVREARALVWLLPALGGVSWLAWSISRPLLSPPDPPTEVLATANEEAGDGAVSEEGSVSGGGRSRESLSAFTTPDLAAEPTAEAPTLFRFDPNTIEYHDLVRLGFTRSEALGIVKYRARGKVFEIAEDFAACYQVSEAMYGRLKHCIVIGEKYRLKPFAPKAGGAKSVQEAGGSLDVVSGRLDTAMQPQQAALIELNSADSATLLAIVGIGSGTLPAIIEYRARLGGFVRVEQLAEVRGVRESNYERIVTQIFVDTLAIQKIDINFAPASELARHPYIGPAALRKLLKLRQLKGGWSSTGELEKEHIFTTVEFARLRTYLSFGTVSDSERSAHNQFNR